MNVKVAYVSKSGNTKKLADRIAQTAGVTAEEIKNISSVEADVLFLGASVYWNGIDGAAKKFIDNLDASKVKEVVVFSTSAMAERAYPDVKKRLESRGIKVASENFYCRGEFHFLHKDRPNDADLASAEKFTKDVLAKRA